MRVSPFRDPRINGYVRLPAAYRSLSRLSSALSAKASALCPFCLTFCSAILAYMAAASFGSLFMFLPLRSSPLSDPPVKALSMSFLSAFHAFPPRYLPVKEFPVGVSACNLTFDVI